MVRSGVEYQACASDHGQVARPNTKAFAGQVNGDEGGRTCRVDDHAGTTKVEVIGNPAGRNARCRSDGRICINRTAIGVERLQVIGVVNGKKHPGLAASKNRVRLPGVLECLARDFEQQPLLGIDGGGLAPGNSEERSVKQVHAIEEASPTRVHLAGTCRIGIVVTLDVPTRARNFGDRIDAVGEKTPECRRRVSAAGKATAHANDRDRIGADQVARFVGLLRGQRQPRHGVVDRVVFNDPPCGQAEQPEPRLPRVRS